MEEKELTERESVEIITQMIEKTKKEAVDIKSFLMLGYPLATSMIALAIMHACLNIPNSMMWFSCFNVVIIFIVGLWVVARQTNKERKQNSSVSYTDKIVHCVAAVNWYANIILSMAMFFAAFIAHNEDIVSCLILFEALLFVLSIMTIQSILRIKLSTTSIGPTAGFMILLSFIGHISFLTVACIAASAILVFGFIVPAHLMTPKKSNINQ